MFLWFADHFFISPFKFIPNLLHFLLIWHSFTRPISPINFFYFIKVNFFIIEILGNLILWFPHWQKVFGLNLNISFSSYLGNTLIAFWGVPCTYVISGDLWQLINKYWQDCCSNKQGRPNKTLYEYITGEYKPGEDKSNITNVNQRSASPDYSAETP